MDPLTVNFSLGLVLTSASAGMWLLHKERGMMIQKYASIEARLNEAEKGLSKVKSEERALRKKMHNQASLSQLEDKMKKAEKKLVAVVKAKA